MLTAKSEEHDKVLGLNVGADDYIIKPFNPMEVVARVRSHLRRYTSLGGIKQSLSQLASGPLVMDTESREVTVDGKPVALTPIEYNILKLLLEKAGKVFLQLKYMKKSGNLLHTEQTEPLRSTSDIYAKRLK